MLRALPVILCFVCVVAAVTFGDEHRLSEFLPDPDIEREAPTSLRHRYVDPIEGPTDLDAAQVRERLNRLVESVEEYKSESGALPESLADLTPGGLEGDGTALIPGGRWRIPVDPWGSAYELVLLDEGHFEVRSLGPDREAHTADDLLARK